MLFGSSPLGIQFVVLYKPQYGLTDLTGANEAGAFKFPVCTGMTGTPAKISVLKFLTAVCPAAVAYMKIDDAIRRVEFTVGKGKAGNQNDWYACAPGQPRKPATQANKEIGVG